MHELRIAKMHMPVVWLYHGKMSTQVAPFLPLVYDSTALLDCRLVSRRTDSYYA